MCSPATPKTALTDYYDAVYTLCKAQQNYAKSMQVLEKKITDKGVFLDIIKQVQLPCVKVEIRTVEELEKLEGKTYSERSQSYRLFEKSESRCS